MEQPDRVLLCDANVLIDFLEVEEGILLLAAQELGSLVVLSTTLEKVDLLSPAGCRRLGLELIDASTELLLEAGPPIPGLAFDDRVLVLYSLKGGCICVTNDKSARQHLEARGASPLWGLDLVLELVGLGAYAPAKARALVEKLAKNSPRHYSRDVLERFDSELKKLATRQTG